MQPVSQEIYKLKYANKEETTPADTFQRVARALAAIETNNQDEWEQRFFDAMCNGAIPAGRIMSNAGAIGKDGTSTINCVVSGTIGDSMEGIMQSVSESAFSLKAGCGIGYEFSTIRPRGAYVRGAGAQTSGPLPFMDIFDAMCFSVASAGGRRGAQMATFDVHHPDIFDFIRAKREDGRFRQFNCSVLVTDEFMQAVKSDINWVLSFPSRSGLSPLPQIWREFPVTPKDTDYTRDSNDLVRCDIYQTIRARDLWNEIMQLNYNYAEPGILFIDQINRENPLNWCETIRATNPCGEQPLPPYGSCLLGSIDLTKFVMSPFKAPFFNFESFKQIVHVFTRMLDNVVELNNLPLGQQRAEIRHKRRHGMGITGLGSALNMMGIPYGSREAQHLLTRIMKTLAIEGLRTGIDLAKEKGSAPILRTTNNRAAMASTPYMQRLFAEEPELQDTFIKHGSRFTHHVSIAPTGTISLAFCNNASNGIEPTFAHHYKRNVLIEGKKTKQQQDVYSAESLMYQTLYDTTELPSLHNITADNLTPEQHLAMQAIAQPWVDSSISKTINVPTNIPFEQFQNIYIEAWQLGLKGCTTYRYNPEGVGAVLMRPEDQTNQKFTFTLEDGTSITAKGDEKIEYDGDIHVAANLYEAIKEGRYGRI